MNERYKAIKLLRESGATYEEIGKRFCITGARAAQIYRQAIRCEKKERDFPGLSVRTINILHINGIETMEQLWAEYLNDDYGISQIKGIGKKMMREIDEAIEVFIEEWR